MTISTYDKLVKQIDELQVDEQLQLASYVLDRARQTVSPLKPRPKWRELRNIVTHPALGQDAQTWVSRTRSESDAQRNA